MLEFPGKIPVRIYPAFWLFAALIGLLSTFSLVGTLIWVGVILISVLFHEYGHALTALFFKRSPRIDLVALGGLTYHEGKEISKGKQFLIVLNGPMFGFVLFFIAAFFLKSVPSQGVLKVFLSALVWVNLIWTIINLLPILPLDGGQLVRIAFESIWGVKGIRYAFFVSMLVGGGIALVCFLYQVYLMGALVFIFAFQSFDSWRKSAQMVEIDQSEEMKTLLAKAEVLIAEGKMDEACALLQEFRKKAEGGLLYNIATQDLAYVLFRQGKLKEVYFLLKPIKEQLNEEGSLFLHAAAFEMKDYPTVQELAGPTYQLAPSFENALRNAIAEACLKDVPACLGWLETAKDFEQDLYSITQMSAFDPIKEEKAFQSFVQELKQGRAP